jgi:hypothetical protein
MGFASFRNRYLNVTDGLATIIDFKAVSVS